MTAVRAVVWRVSGRSCVKVGRSSEVGVKVGRGTCLKVGRRSCQGQSEVGVKVGQRSVSRSVGGMCQGRSDVGVKVGREYVSKLVGGRVKVGRSELSLTVAVSEVGLTLAAAGCRFSVRI